MSGAPIVDCKKAIFETDGDIEKAIDWLRQYCSAKTSKKLSDIDAENGLIAVCVSETGKSASIVKISCETDFSAKTDKIVKLACYIASDTLDGRSNSSCLSESVQIILDEAIVAIRENIGVSSAVKLTTERDDTLMVGYVHGKVHSNFHSGLSAAVVEIVGVKKSDHANEIGKRLAMHIVSAKPLYLDPSCVPSEVIEKEKEILQKQIADTKKPPEIVEKIINGRMNKFYSQICLTEQEHMVEEGNVTVSKALKNHDLSVKSFILASV